MFLWHKLKSCRMSRWINKIWQCFCSIAISSSFNINIQIHSTETIRLEILWVALKYLEDVFFIKRDSNSVQRILWTNSGGNSRWSNKSSITKAEPFIVPFSAKVSRSGKKITTKKVEIWLITQKGCELIAYSCKWKILQPHP